MALNVLGSQFDKLLNVTLCYPQNSSHPFYDMLSGKLTRIVVRVNLEPVKEELHGDYVNDKGFKRRFQLWLNTLWAEKDAQIDAIKASTKKPVSDRLFVTSGLPDISRYRHTAVQRYPCCWYPCLADSPDICHSQTSPEPLQLQIGSRFFLLRDQ